MHMYLLKHCPYANFEWDLSSHVCVMALDMKKSKQNGHQAAILDRIVTQITMHMYLIEHHPCYNFE